MAAPPPPDDPIPSHASSITLPPPHPPTAIPPEAAPPPLAEPTRQKDFGFLPIPKRLQWDPDNPPDFTLLLSLVFGFAATFTAANLYYVQPILILLSEDFQVSYERVTNIPTLLQAAYACGIVFICPLGDLLRRRQLFLLLVFLSSACTLWVFSLAEVFGKVDSQIDLSRGLVFVKNVAGFQVLSFFVGLVSVTPQILIPLAGDLAKPEKRASAVANVLSGILLGLLFGRVVAGVVAKVGRVADIYYTALGLQVAVWFLMYLTVPDYPAKNKGMTYVGILWSMAKFAVTEPLLIQSCLISMISAVIWSSFWTDSTFILGNIFGYNSLEIGLFALVGVAAVLTAPLVGKIVDKLVGWLGVFIGIFIIAVMMAIYTAAIGLSVGAVVVCIFLLDIGMQMEQISCSSRIFAINEAARTRFAAIYIFSVFIGQLVGTSGLTRVYLQHSWRASGGAGLGVLGIAFIILFARGPHLPSNRWVGWGGGWELRKMVAERKQRDAQEIHQSEVDSEVVEKKSIAV